MCAAQISHRDWYELNLGFREYRPRKGPRRLAGGLVVRTPSIGGAENAASFAYPLRVEQHGRQGRIARPIRPIVASFVDPATQPALDPCSAGAACDSLPCLGTLGGSHPRAQRISFGGSESENPMPSAFVHGNPEAPALWRTLVSALKDRGATDLHLLAPSGFGAPVPDGWQSSQTEYRDWLIGELESLGG